MKLLLLAAAACVLATSASAQTVAPKAVVKGGGNIGLGNRLVRTCVSPNPGYIFLQPDGGYQETAQGWFIRAQVQQSTSWAIAYCYYGLDEAAPANRPVYSVHYEMTGYKSNQCTVSGKTVTCVRQAVLQR